MKSKFSCGGLQGGAEFLLRAPPGPSPLRTATVGVAFLTHLVDMVSSAVVRQDLHDDLYVLLDVLRRLLPSPAHQQHLRTTQVARQALRLRLA